MHDLFHLSPIMRALMRAPESWRRAATNAQSTFVVMTAPTFEPGRYVQAKSRINRPNTDPQYL